MVERRGGEGVERRKGKGGRGGGEGRGGKGREMLSWYFSVALTFLILFC